MATFSIPITVHAVKGTGCSSATVQGGSTYTVSILATGTGSASQGYVITGSATVSVSVASSFSSGYSFNNWSHYVVSGTDFGWTVSKPSSASGTVTISAVGNTGGTIGATDIYLTASATASQPSGQYSANPLTAGFYRNKNGSSDHTACSYSTDFGIASCTPTSGTSGTTITYTAQINPGFTLQTWEYANCTYSSGQGTSTLKVKINGTGNVEARPVYSLEEYTATFNPNGGTWSDNTTANKTSKYQWTPISLVKGSTNYIGQFNPVVYASDGSNRLSSDPANANYYVGDLYNAYGSGTTATSANNLLNHYINNGISEGRTASNLSTTYYDGTVSRSGYTFAGWKITSVSGSGWTNGTTYTGSANTPKYILGYNAANKYGNVTFTAQWTASTYTVNFYQGNNSTTAGSTLLGSQTITRDVATALTTYASLGGTVPSGWTFYGWATSQTSTTRTYTNGKSVTNIASAGGSIDLYALFSKTFTFKSGISQATSSTATQIYNPYKTTGYLTSITAPVPTAIDGWSTLGYRVNTTATTATYAVTDSATSITPAYNSSATMYAVYSRTITVYSGANKATTNTLTQYYNTNPTITSVTLPTPTAISNWTSLGYRSNTTAGEATISAGSYTPAVGDSVSAFYAVYSRVYTMSYNANGGSGTQESTTKTVYMNTNSTSLNLSINFPQNTFTAPTGQQFQAWTLGSTSGIPYGAGAQYHPGLEYNASSWTETSYAKWMSSTSDWWIKQYRDSEWIAGVVKIWSGSSWNYAAVYRQSSLGSWLIGP